MKRAGPESITPNAAEYGFRVRSPQRVEDARKLAYGLAPRNDAALSVLISSDMRHRPCSLSARGTPSFLHSALTLFSCRLTGKPDMRARGDGAPCGANHQSTPCGVRASCDDALATRRSTGGIFSASGRAFGLPFHFAFGPRHRPLLGSRRVGPRARLLGRAVSQLLAGGRSAPERSPEAARELRLAKPARGRRTQPHRFPGAIPAREFGAYLHATLEPAAPPQDRL